MKYQIEVEHFFKHVYPAFTNSKDKVKIRKLIIFKKNQFLNKSISAILSKCIYWTTSKVSMPIYLLDKIFFLKNEYLKNNTQGKNLFLKAIWSSFMLVVIILLIVKYSSNTSVTDLTGGKTLDVKDLSLIFALFFGLYWNARTVFTQKWDYAASLFNKLCFDVPFRSYKSEHLKNIAVSFHQSTLSLDLLTLEIWSHKSFKECFKESLEIAILYKSFLNYYSINNVIDLNVIISNSIGEINKISSNDYCEFDIISEILSQFQSDLSNYVIHNNDF